MKIVNIEPGTGYWKVTVGSDWKESYEASYWCQAHQCGKQVGMRQFAFRNESEITMFRLQWETE